MVKIERFEAVGKCLFWREKKTLVIGDLHLGYEDSLVEQGIAVLKTELNEILEDLKKIFEIVGKVKKVILLGDVKHYFGRVLAGEFNGVYKVFDLIKGNLYVGGELLVCKGNHDTALESVVNDYDFVSLRESFVIEDVLFSHGDKINLEKIDKKIKLVVIGHHHPAITLQDREGIKKERYKCFYFGDGEKQDIIFAPSFSNSRFGVESLPWFDGKLKVFIVSEEKVYDFGGVGS